MADYAEVVPVLIASVVLSLYTLYNTRKNNKKLADHPTAIDVDLKIANATQTQAIKYGEERAVLKAERQKLQAELDQLKELPALVDDLTKRLNKVEADNQSLQQRNLALHEAKDKLEAANTLLQNDNSALTERATVAEAVASAVNQVHNDYRILIEETLTNTNIVISQQLQLVNVLTAQLINPSMSTNEEIITNENPS